MTGAVLVLYYEPLRWRHLTAQTVLDHVHSFERYSRFPVFTLNTGLRLPERVARFDFQAIVLHYSLFAPRHYHLDQRCRELLASSRGYKLAFFQDEHHYCQDRFRFCDEFQLDCVYTCLEPSEYDKVWRKYTDVDTIRTTLPGYVDERLVAAAERHFVPDRERSVDVGYRGRPLAPYMGRAAEEKTEIGRRFAELAADSGLVLDVGLGEEDRLYGEDWHRFVANCRAILGVESGVSAFDTEDEILRDYERLLEEKNGEVTLADLERGPLGAIDGRIFYRTVAPRHFEAAAFRACQVLFEGRYSGTMEPMAHYIPLRKDFSNIDEVVERVKDPRIRTSLAERAHRDLIVSGKFSYRAFVAGFDRDLIEAGLDPGRSPESVAAVSRAVARGTRAERRRWAARERASALRSRPLRAYQSLYTALVRTRGGAALARGIRRLRGPGAV